MKIRIQAFSLIEILVAVIIVGVVASIAFSNFGVIFEKARAKEGEQTLYSILAAIKSYQVEHNGQNPTLLSQLGVSYRQSQYFHPPAIVFSGTLYAQVRRIGPRVRYNYPDGSWEIRENAFYILNISNDGTIFCNGDPTPICARMGY